MGKGGGVPQTTAAPAPPPTSSTLEVQQAKIDAARQSKAKKGINSTILQGQGELAAGQPIGGAAAGNPDPGQQSVPKSILLGGG